MGQSSSEVPEDTFAEAVIARVCAARLGLSEAAATVDSRALAEALAELEDALALARNSDVYVPKVGGQ